MLFADVILPVPLHSFLTYSVPKDLQQIIHPGSRVCVPLGRSKRLTGIVFRMHTDQPEGYKTKPIEAVLDQSPLLLPEQLKLIEWIAQYYMCTMGDVMKAMLPAGLRPDSNNMDDTFRPKTETYVRMDESVHPDNIEDILVGLKRSTKQAETLRLFLELSGMNRPDSQHCPVLKKRLAELCNSTAALSALEGKHILQFYRVETGRLPIFSGHVISPVTLNEIQLRAMNDIKECFKTKNVCLLHGVTSCGKTEIYIHLIKEQLEKGNQVLYLLPEIALTTQIVWRLQRFFGDDMCVYHSRCSDNLRVEVWNKQAGDKPYGLVLGARSAVMLPFKRLGLVIVDEEHETSYKQESPAPRYNARNTAIMAAMFHKAKVLLGSATPAFESYCNALQGKYGLVTITKRYLQLPTPLFEIVDTAQLKRKKYMQGLFSPCLTEHINQALEAGEQVILFHNRRGYTQVVECEQCGWIQQCDRCDVSLTYHKFKNLAVCHYCGRSYSIPLICPKCGAKTFRGVGFGTERIEEVVGRLFPNARVARLDLDSVSRKGQYEDILQNFQDKKTDILIGTQMISKGLDFNNVSVVGILQADQMMSFPDFRSTERAYQLMTQVAGRAGRKHHQGVVVVQTKDPEQHVLKNLLKGDFKSFFYEQMEERRAFMYPPYTRLTTIWMKCKNEKLLDKAATVFANKLTDLFRPDMVLGPDAPAVSREQNFFIRKILIKIDNSTSVAKVHESLVSIQKSLVAIEAFKSLIIYYDVDPV